MSNQNLLHEFVTHSAYPGVVMRVIEVMGDRLNAEIRPNELTREVTRVNDKAERFVVVSDRDD
ncbi:MAG: hypothetical protein AAFY26_06090 [Cyanobacteria bacterium J06638_22]